MINREVVETIAKLSRLYLDEEEIVLYAQQLSQILETIEELRQIDTDNIEPLAHVMSVENVFREDIAGECFHQEKVLSNTSEQMDGMFQVPKIV